MGVPIWPKDGVKKRKIQLHKPLPRSGEIELRDEIKKILDGDDSSPQRGHWILLRRMETAQRCTCWNAVGEGTDKYSSDDRKYDEPDENCTICNGNGWVYDDELHLVRRRLVAPPIGLSGQEQQAPVGIINIPYVVYYFKYYVNPSSKDKIIEIENNVDGTPKKDSSDSYIQKEVFNISTVESFRDINGRIEYWRAAVKLEAI